MELDYAEEHTLRLAVRDGSVTAEVCREGEPCEEGQAHLALYEGMARRGLLHLSQMRGSRFSPSGAEWVQFVPTEAGQAVIALRDSLLTAEARLESTTDVLNDLADQLHVGTFKDRHGHKAQNLAALKAADRLLDQLTKADA